LHNYNISYKLYDKIRSIYIKGKKMSKKEVKKVVLAYSGGL